MRDEDLEAAHHLGEWNAAVLLPVLHRLSRVDQDDEVVILALVVHLNLDIVSAHVCSVVVGGWLKVKWKSQLSLVCVERCVKVLAEVMQTRSKKSGEDGSSSGRVQVGPWSWS